MVTADASTSAAPVAIGIDIGGTHLRAARVAADGSLHHQVRRETPARSTATLVDVLVEVVRSFPDELPVGIGIAGLVTRDGVVRYGPNIDVRDLALSDDLGRRLDREVAVLNDGSAAVLAEQRVGAAQGYLDVVMLTLGTGVGGGLTQAGDLVLGRSGYAGEVGHILVEEGGRPCPCGNRGCIEAYASGTAIGALAGERLAEDDRTSRMRDHDGTLDGRAVSEAAHAGDAVAQEVLVTAGGWLGVAAASIVNLLDPEILLVGGGAATSSAPWLLPAAREAMERRLLGRGFRTPPLLDLAILGDDAGTVGAGLYVTDRAAAGGPA